MADRITKEEYLEGVTEEYKRKRSRKWYMLYPGAVYANDFDFRKPVTLERAIDQAMWWLGVEDLPAGIQFWIG